MADESTTEMKDNASVSAGKQFGSFWYLPIALVVLAGYGLGLFGWYHCGLKPVVFNFDELSVHQVYLSLFSVGLIGGSMYCSKFMVEDANVVMYSGKGLPNWVDPFAYAMKILGGGVTGVVFYLVVRLGIGLATEGKATEEVIVTEAGWVMAFAGGFATDRIREFILRLVRGKVGDGDGSKKTATPQPNSIQNATGEASIPATGSKTVAPATDTGPDKPEPPYVTTKVDRSD